MKERTIFVSIYSPDVFYSDVNCEVSFSDKSFGKRKNKRNKEYAKKMTKKTKNTRGSFSLNERLNALLNKRLN